MPMSAKNHIDRLGQMKSLRSTWETHWQEVLDYVVPRKADVNRTRFPGDRRNLNLYDSSAEQSNELLAGALHSMLTNPTNLWFELTTGNQVLDNEDDVRTWLKETAEVMFNVMNNSNFQTEMHEVYIDLGSIGTACLSIEEDPEHIVRFASRFMGQIYVSENNLGRIDTVYREFKWKVRQAMQEWGEVPALRRYKNSPEHEIEILHAVYPRMERDTAKKNPANMRFASDYVIVESAETISQSGYNTFPYAVPRWTKATGEAFGRSPGMKALPDIKMINEMMKTMIKAGQKSVDPPMMVPDDGFILPVDLTPSGINYYRAGSTDRIEPLKNDVRLDFGYQIMEDVRKRIRDAFYIDQLQLSQGPQMTATEVMQRTEEKMRLIGPVMGRQHSELLRPTIDRVFQICWAANKIPQPPEVLRGQKIDVQYTSTIAKAQRSQDAQNIMRALQVAQPFIQVNPTIMDNFDGDEALRWSASLYGVPPRIIRDKKTVQKIRADRAQAEAQAAQMQKEMMAAEAANKLAPVAEVVQDGANQNANQTGTTGA